MRQLPTIPAGIDPNNPTDEFVSNIDIHTLLPQQEPFVMVGRLVHYDAVQTVTETTVDERNILVDDGEFSATGLTENIAQTCAARIGYVNQYILRQDIAAGVIAAIAGEKIHRQPKVGETIRTTLTIDAEVFGMIMANATISVGQENIVEVKNIKLKV